MRRTTIAVPVDVRDRLMTYGRKGQTYADILGLLMDRVTPGDLDEGLPFLATRYFSEGEVQAARRTSPSEKLQLAERVRTATRRANPTGWRMVVESRRRQTSP